MLIHTIEVQRGELALENSAEWREARAVLDRVPEYAQKVRRMRQTMGQTQQLVAKVEKGSAALRAKIEDKDRERAAKKTADAAEFQKVVQR
jgi:hypothetical protein